jgi:predicted CoA-binding protein
MKNETVVIVGASDKVDRYSYKALRMLEAHHHTPIPVHPTHPIIESYPVVSDLSQITVPVDTVTMYVNSEASNGMKDKLIALKPKRVIFNPGAENNVLSMALMKAGIKTENACTLVLLSTGQY